MSADPKAPEPPTDADLTRMHGVSPSTHLPGVDRLPLAGRAGGRVSAVHCSADGCWQEAHYEVVDSRTGSRLFAFCNAGGPYTCGARLMFTSRDNPHRLVRPLATGGDAQGRTP